MIIFYNKKTGDIIGTVDGRVHSKHITENAMIIPKGLTKEEVGKYIVQIEPVIEEIEEPIMELRVTDKKTMKVENVQIGIKKIKRTKELIFGGEYGKMFRRIEKRKDSIYNYRVEVDDNGGIKTFKLKTKKTSKEKKKDI